MLAVSGQEVIFLLSRLSLSFAARLHPSVWFALLFVLVRSYSVELCPFWRLRTSPSALFSELPEFTDVSSSVSMSVTFFPLLPRHLLRQLLVLPFSEVFANLPPSPLLTFFIILCSRPVTSLAGEASWLFATELRISAMSFLWKIFFRSETLCFVSDSNFQPLYSNFDDSARLLRFFTTKYFRSLTLRLLNSFLRSSDSSDFPFSSPSFLGDSLRCSKSE